LYGKLKLKGLNVELVTEYAKDLVYDGTINDVLHRQEYIFAEQHKRIARLESVDVVITDSPLLLSTCYIPDNFTGAEHFIKFVHETNNKYDNINILLKRTEHAIFRKEGRNHNQEQSVTLDHQIQNILTDYPHKSIAVTDDVSNRLYYYILHQLQDPETRFEKWFLTHR